MAIPSLVQGMIETEDGKVFELDSPKGSAWLELIGSFRFEPSGDSKPYTVRKEASAYWYGCRKVAGKVRKKYIGKSSSLTVAKLEEIAEALEIPPVPRANKVAEVAERVTEGVAEEVIERVIEGVAEVAEMVAEGVTEGVAEVAEMVAEDRLTALELQVTNLRKAVEALQKALQEKLESGDSLELPKVDNEVAEQLPGDSLELPKVDNEVVEQLQNELGNLKAENEKLRADYAALLESSTHVTNKLRQEVQELRSQLQTERISREPIETELAKLAADQEDLAQLKKEVKEHAHELHREERSMELEKVRWQQELSDARAELADAKATMLVQSNKIRELERGYNFKPNPAESRLRMEIGELRSQLEIQRADREEIEVELSDLKQIGVAEYRYEFKISPLL